MPTEQKTIRKLSAILSADVKGYSLLMADNEAQTIQTLKANRQIMFDLITQHSGRVIDSPGDNLLAEFGSAVDAVECAVDIQNRLKKENAQFADNQKLQFRIGINIGDVVQDEDRIYGSGVNIAARIEGLADPGGTCISRNAYDQIKDKLKLGYEYLGQHEVKNIKDPVRVYRVLSDPKDAGKLIGEEPQHAKKKWLLPVVIVAAIIATSIVWHFYQSTMKPDIEPASVEKMAFPLPDKPSIAVLPFDNMTGDPKQEYLTDGITEEIISNLSKIAELLVIARNSTFVYKGKPVKVQKVAEELGVRYVLEGSVRKAEDRLRITVQLVDALTGHHMWSESYDRELKDIFALQDDISMEVLTAMRVKLSDGEQARLSRKGTKNLKAYLKVLEGNEQGSLFNKEASIRAKQLYEEAIALEPEYGAAYGLLGLSHLGDTLFGWTKSPAESLHKAFELSQKTLSLDDSLPIPYRTISNIYLLQKKYEKAITNAQQAVELSPNASVIIFNLGWILRCAGRPKEGIPLLEKAIRLDPIPSVILLDSLGRAYFLTGQYEEAIAEYKKGVKLKPDYRDTHVGLAATYAVLDREEEARSEVSEILRIEPSFSIEKYKRFMYFQVGLEPEIEGLRKAGLPE